MRTAMVAATLAGVMLATLSFGQDKKQPEKKIAPKITLVLPLGISPGTTAKLTVRGVNLEQAKEVKLQEGVAKILGKGKSAPPDKLPPEKYGDSHVELEAKLPDKVTKTPISFTIVTPEGETAPHVLLVETQLPLVKEKEPNEGFRQAQVLQAPCVVEGSVERQRDVDVYRIEGKAGQKLTAEVTAARHGSALDALLTLYTAEGNQLASSAEKIAGPDARITATLPANGVYYLSLIDAHDSGGALHVYRLTVK